MTKSTLSTARSRLRSSAGAVAIAGAAFFGGQQTAPAPYLASPAELREVMGKTLGTGENEVRFARMNLAGGWEAIAVEIPSENWTAADLKDYLQRLDYFKVRCQSLLEAREEFEAAYADSASKTKGP